MTTAYPDYVQTKEFNSGVTVFASSKPADATRMSVDTEGAAHIMSLLTDLYSDPNLAVFREYVSNALDAHTEAGQTRAIDITLPSQFDPTFKVQDYGIGMSVDTIRDIYSAYGKSTKRHNFGQIGAFGLGCKSALTLAQQFSLVSIKDGHRTVASISRGDDGVGTVNIVSQTETTEGNGTTVKIPIKDIYNFANKATNFFIAMPAGKALVDGVEPRNRDSLGFQPLAQQGAFYRTVTDSREQSQNLYISMGGIAYPVEKYKLANETWTNSRFDTSQTHYQMLIDIPIASVDLTPSRESLRYTDRTVKFLSSLFEGCFTSIVNDMLSEVDSLPTRQEVLAKIKDYVSKFDLLKREEFTWQGKPVVFFINSVDHTEVNLTPRGNDFVTSVSTGTSSVTIPDDRPTYLVEAPNTEYSRLRSNFKSFVAQTRGQIEKSDLFIFAKGETPTEEWLIDNEHVTVLSSTEDIYTAARAYRKANRTPYIRGPRGKVVEMEYDSQRVEKGELFREDVKISDTDKKYTYVVVRQGVNDENSYFSGKEKGGPTYVSGSRQSRMIYDEVQKSYPKVVFIFLPRTRKLEPLQARFKKAGLKAPKLFADWSKGKFMELVKSSPYTHEDYSDLSTYRSYDERDNEKIVKVFREKMGKRLATILDPEIHTLTEKTKTSNGTDTSNFDISLQDLIQAAAHLHFGHEIKTYFNGLPKRPVQVRPFLKPYLEKNYPIIASVVDNWRYYGVDSKVVDHTVLYINAAFVAAGRKSK